MKPTEFSKRYLPEITVDVVLLAIGTDGSLQTLLTRRDDEPFCGDYALPGVFVKRVETLEAAAARALEDKGGLTQVFLEQLYTFGDPQRDPRNRIVSVAYYALVPEPRYETARARSDVSVARIEVPWPGVQGGAVHAYDDAGKRLTLAFDHSRIIGTAVQRVRGKLGYAPIGFELLPNEFTLLDLRRIHEAILGHKLNKDSFRRTVLASALIEDTNTRRTDTSYRPAALYRFKKES
jgi:8-oxo-dGTP diphosphatase